MERCGICGTSLKDDLFAYVTNDPVCCICKAKWIGGLPTTMERIRLVRKQLNLADGEYLQQDNHAEAKKMLGR